MKALIDLRSNTNWAKLYFDIDMPLTINLNEYSLMKYYFNKLSLLGVKVVEVVPSSSEEDLGHIEELALIYGFELVFLVRDISFRDSYFSVSSRVNDEYSIVIEGALSIPSVKVLKRLLKKQPVYMGEYRDNIGGLSSCLITLSDYYRHMLKCINPKAIGNEGSAELIKTIFTKGLEFGKGLYFKEKIVVRHRIIDPINNFFLVIEDENIISWKAS